MHTLLARNPFWHYRKAYVFWECSCGYSRTTVAGLADLAIRIHLGGSA